MAIVLNSEYIIRIAGFSFKVYSAKSFFNRLIEPLDLSSLTDQRFKFNRPALSTRASPRNQCF